MSIVSLETPKGSPQCREERGVYIAGSGGGSAIVSGVTSGLARGFRTRTLLGSETAPADASAVAQDSIIVPFYLSNKRVHDQ